MLFNVPGAKVVAGFSGNCNATAFIRMLELAMAAARGNEHPAVVSQHGQDVVYLHVVRITTDRLKSLIPRQRHLVDQD